MCLLTDSFIRRIPNISEKDDDNVIRIYLNRQREESLNDALRHIKKFKMFRKILNFLRIQIHENNDKNNDDNRSIRGGANAYIIVLLFLCVNSIFASMIRPAVIQKNHMIQDDAISIKNAISIKENIEHVIDRSVRHIQNKINTALNNIDFADQLLSLDKTGKLKPYVEKMMRNKDNIVNMFSDIQKKLNIATIVLEGIQKRSMYHTIGGFYGMIRDDMVSNLNTGLIGSAGNLAPHVNLMIRMIKELPENMETLDDIDRNDFLEGHLIGGGKTKRRHRHRRQRRRPHKTIRRS